MKRKFSALLLGLSVFFSVMLSGCAFSLSFRSGDAPLISCGDEVMSEPEVRLIALQYKCCFESFYKELLSDSFWQCEVSEGISYADYVKEYFVFRECRALLYLGILAEEQGISIDEAYDGEFSAAAQTYYQSLSHDELRYTEASQEDVERVMRRYALASLIVETSLADVSVEVSEEESRVADIQIIRVAERPLAEELYQRIEDGESFLSLAKENTLDDRIDYSVCKGQLISVLDELVFSMDTYEISAITEADGSFYIIRMVNTCDALLSGRQKEKLTAEKRFLAWEHIYESQESRFRLRRNRKAYEEISLSKSGDFPYTDLFGLVPRL